MLVYRRVAYLPQPLVHSVTSLSGKTPHLMSRPTYLCWYIILRCLVADGPLRVGEITPRAAGRGCVDCCQPTLAAETLT